MNRMILVAVLLGASTTAQAQQQPVPQLKKTAADHPSQPYAQRPIVGWQVFNGAKECKQVEGVLTCDNGYTRRVR